MEEVMDKRSFLVGWVAGCTGTAVGGLLAGVTWATVGFWLVMWLMVMVWAFAPKPD